MSSLHKFKAYFGMVPLDDYEDEYLDEPEPARRPARPARDSGRDPYLDRDDRDFVEPAFSKAAYAPGRRDDLDDDFDRYDPPRHSSRVEPVAVRSARPSASGAVRGSTRGALAVDTRSERVESRRGPLFDEGGPLSKITTLRPRDYGEARTIGERFRDGTPVIMDLVEMSNADAKRLVDFAAGLAFALRGSFDKVATKVFLLSPADIDVSAEERRRIAETGFYSQK
ncbi:MULTISPECIES: cell division protein SepF [Rhodococcus]|uniref:cell division protein SepF n=1 Tax=Rhodococcus TaxID=1827 RepID=UPI0003132AE3|nr:MULTISPECIES: cell division protein SepF [Rhodococcus]KXF51473.1 cell division protein SepF [Rhodococcus sp. SC4]AHK32383.1 Cell division protein sepF [Rhodococcus opacus PD630]KXX59314.1 cell division protein SepF [Rhodococcus sp. LB1]PBC50233.1 cell division protein SepF [Rhodococcus sp. ACPA1]UDG94770.1 cell division protein SepF [Rhodococcus opacus PD630]